MTAYLDFLRAKMKVAEATGFEVDDADINPDLAPHCRAIVKWAIAGGRRAIFAAFGLHKTSIQLELMRLIGAKVGGRCLIVLPLGVRHEFFSEAKERFRGRFAISLKFIRSDDEIDGDEPIYIANYESVRDGKIDPALFTAASLDEAAILRGYGTKTFQVFLPLFEGLAYKFVATATPSPNRTKELIHYAGFLEVMDTGQALTRFFQRNSEKANELTLYPHKEDEFWLWVNSWAVFLQSPADLGFPDDGYVLPEMKVTWHEVQTNHGAAGFDRDGQGLLINDPGASVIHAAREKRVSMDARVNKMLDVIGEAPDEHRILWHHLEDERRAIEATVPEVRSIFGNQDLDVNEQNAIDFKEGRFRDLATKPEMSGAGCNFQRHCAWAIFLGIDAKFHDFIQAIYRIVRFGQSRACRIDIIYSEAEHGTRRILEEKWAEHNEMMARMTEIIRKYGLGKLPLESVLQRSIGAERREERGQFFTIVNNDCVDEARRLPADSIGEIITSIPFSNHYEYTASYNDFGHTDDNAHFWAQMDFLTPELYRILKPGRLACIHVKDRILFGNVTGTGLPTVSPFHAEAIFHFSRHGFDYCGMITVDTDVVTENNGNYRLGYTEMLKDGTKMGVGSPEYVLLFHKPQSDRTKGYADDRVSKSRDDYSLARWQLDAHAHWRSSGDRLLTRDEWTAIHPRAVPKAFRAYSEATVYDHEAVVAIGEVLQSKDRLPTEYMALAPVSHSPWIWSDVVRMLTLNGSQAQRNVEKHICPLQFDIVDRLIDRYSSPGDVIFDPFGGLMTVPYRAILKGRIGMASELNETSFVDGLYYCHEAEAKRNTPSFFDLLEGRLPMVDAPSIAPTIAEVAP
ncbi:MULTISPECIES: DNA methyltransferase [unclassified Mesorhizobium]|uniref:DNA methyltransferase n=1 Tax=unclassified Mesorhizobium TaxID=325217 RepID=UPI000FCCC5D6|nr:MULTISPECIES: DNA methyltransferase [unclassified Mesorhizobium]RUV23451.1 DNA methylase N-4 [Mesorhizobium sp. M1A.F.Ca.IN.022.04.1.1]RWG29760.1 MAG: DNA methylase N-4 [Mesorhizobium sp.]